MVCNFIVWNDNILVWFWNFFCYYLVNPSICLHLFSDMSSLFLSRCTSLTTDLQKSIEISKLIDTFPTGKTRILLEQLDMQVLTLILELSKVGGTIWNLLATCLCIFFEEVFLGKAFVRVPKNRSMTRSAKRKGLHL
jgi:hypothetical protein